MIRTNRPPPLSTKQRRHQMLSQGKLNFWTRVKTEIQDIAETSRIAMRSHKGFKTLHGRKSGQKSKAQVSKEETKPKVIEMNVAPKIESNNVPANKIENNITSGTDTKNFTAAETISMNSIKIDTSYSEYPGTSRPRRRFRRRTFWSDSVRYGIRIKGVISRKFLRICGPWRQVLNSRIAWAAVYCSTLWK